MRKFCLVKSHIFNTQHSPHKPFLKLSHCQQTRYLIYILLCKYLKRDVQCILLFLTGVYKSTHFNYKLNIIPLLILSQQEHPLTSTTPILNTLPCRSNSFSTVKVSAKTGRSSDWTTVYVKDQSSPYQFYSNSATVLSLFAGNQPVKHFRVVTIIDAPFTMEVPYLLSGDKSFYQCDRGLLCRIPRLNASATTWEQSCCIGHSIDLLTMLMTRLGISVEIYIVEDGFYGSLVNRSFNGMIGDVASGKADLAIAGLTITSLRSTVVDFTSPFIRQDVGIVTKSTKKELEFINWQFAVPIESNVIIAVFLGILLGTFLTYVLENQELVVKRIVDPKGFPPRYLWREGFTYYSGLTFQRDLGGKNPKEFGSRVVAIGFAFAMLVIMTTYTAVLTATKVTQKDPNPFLGVKDQRVRLKNSLLTVTLCALNET